MAGLIHLCNVCLESLWLLAIVLVPMAFIDQSSFHGEAIISYIEVPQKREEEFLNILNEQTSGKVSIL